MTSLISHLKPPLPFPKTTSSKMARKTLLAVLVVIALAGAARAASTPDECKNDMTKLSDCLAYATGKADVPSEKCCTSITDIRGQNPVCLCYIIQQVHNASSSQGLFSMGLQIGKLVELPKACKVPDTNIKDCPALLGIPPNSPDKNIFNITANATAPGASGGTKTPSYGCHIHSPTKVALMVLSAVFMSFV